MKVTGNAPPNPGLTSEISSENSVQKAKSTDKIKAAQSSEIGLDSSVARSGSQVEISDTARLMQKATEVIRAMPEIRQDRISQIKKSIADGSYKVDTLALADKLLTEHLSTDFGKNNV